jgi:glycosyltransferase involved in cell wall biosynthesis
MKILWLSHFLPYPPKGGALQRSHNLLLQAARRHEVHLVSLNQRSILPTPEDVEEATGFLSNLCKRVEVFPIPSDAAKWCWVTMAMVSYLKPSPYDVNWLTNRSMGRFLDGLSKTETFDLIHVDTIGLYPYISAFTETPVVLNHHNIESHMMRRRFEKEKKGLNKIYFHRESAKLKRMEQSVCGKCAVNLVVSQLDGIRLKENAGDVRIFVISNGVDIEYFHPIKAIGERREGLIFAGAMDWYPNREAVLFFLKEIWPKLHKEKPERHATFLGRNPPSELLEAAKNSAVLVPGFVDDVRPYLDDAGIYVCPIRDGGGTRLKILDALAMAKPLVATGLGVEGLDLVDGVHYLRAETAEEFVDQINRLEQNPQLCQILAMAGQRFVQERFSWDVIGKKLDDAYQEAASISIWQEIRGNGENTWVKINVFPRKTD